MKRLVVQITDETDRKLRQASPKKGDLSTNVEKALVKWLEDQEGE